MGFSITNHPAIGNTPMTLETTIAFHVFHHFSIKSFSPIVPSPIELDDGKIQTGNPWICDGKKTIWFPLNDFPLNPLNLSIGHIPNSVFTISFPSFSHLVPWDVGQVGIYSGVQLLAGLTAALLATAIFGQAVPLQPAVGYGSPVMMRKNGVEDVRTFETLKGLGVVFFRCFSWEKRLMVFCLIFFGWVEKCCFT